jgi:hypothetical protein
MSTSNSLGSGKLHFGSPSENILTRLEKMEKFYENKLKILNEKVNLLEKENYRLINEKNQD